MYVTFDKNRKEILQEVVPLLSERVFSTWQVTPIFKVEDFGDDDYVILSLEYNDSTEHETKHKHEAMDLALSFLDGYLSAKGLWESQHAKS